MEMNEMLVKAKKAKTPEELLAIANENGVELDEEGAKAYFEQLNQSTGELSDDELDEGAAAVIRATADWWSWARTPAATLYANLTATSG